MKNVIVNSINISIFLFAILITSCTNPADSEKTNSYLVHIVGRVLTKDGSPVPNAITHLAKYDMYDTTDSKGTYEIILDSSQTVPGLAKSTVNANDTLYILRDGQIITSFEISNYLDTLPDLFIVQRDIAGKIDSSVTEFSRIDAIVWNKVDNIQKKVELFYSKPTYRYSGFIYFVYTGTVQNYSVYVDVYSSDSLQIGRSDTINFTSIAGNIEIPLLDPVNAIPIPHASAANSVGINDTFVLYGTASDNFEGRIIDWAWDAGNTGKFLRITPDSNITVIAPSKVNNLYQCVLRVTDDNGNSAFDTVAISVEARAPIAMLKTTPPNPGLNATVVFSDGSIDYKGTIVNRMLKFGSSDWVNWSGIDTVVKTPGVTGLWPCSLKVVDNDGEIGYNYANLYIGGVPGMVCIPGGSFEMGSSTGSDDEAPVHNVTVSSFFMDTSEVTQRRYKEVMSAAYSNLSAPGFGWGEGDSYAAYDMNWYEAVLFCNACTKAEGRNDTVYSYTSISTITGFTVLNEVYIDLSKKGYRLPTEAEWEYSCRAGTTTEYYWGNETSNIGDYAWYESNSGVKVHPVAQKLPNAFGLYDMEGNVREWCNDRYRNYSSGLASNPAESDSSLYRVTRGGDWSQAGTEMRSASRAKYPLIQGCFSIGFRVVLPL